jgi:hypothetical protein
MSAVKKIGNAVKISSKSTFRIADRLAKADADTCRSGSARNQGPRKNVIRLSIAEGIVDVADRPAGRFRTRELVAPSRCRAVS